MFPRSSSLAVSVVIAAALAVAGCGGGSSESDGAPAAGASATANAPATGGASADAASSGAVGASASVAGAAGGAGTATATPKTDPVLARINAIRASGARCGETDYPPAAAVAAHPDVEEAAAVQTDWMQANRTMSHAGAGGSTPATRLDSAGYAWSGVGENVAAGYPTAAAVIEAWLASPGHCTNLMGAAFVDVGFAYLPAASGAGSYATLVMARPR